MNKKIISIIGVIILALLVIVIFNEKPENHNVKIGAALSLTGMAAVDGQNIKDGIEFAKKKLAKDGIILEVVYEDDGTEPIKTVSAVNKLINIDKVDAIVGPTWSFLSAAVVETIQNKKIVAFNPANTSEHVEGKSDYFLFGASKNSLKEEPTTEWLKRIGSKKVAIVLEQGPWGDSHIKPFENAIKNSGGELVITERIPFGATGSDIQTIISKVINSGADAVMFTGFDSATTVFINKVQELKPGLPVLVATEIVKKQDEDGKINVSQKDNVYVVIPEASQKFREDFYKEYGRYPGSYADRAYDGTMMITKAILEKPENTDLNQYVRQMNYKGYMGTYSFDENNDLVGGNWIIEQLQ
jgi:branched-chain amino acid transport system substrate-binding protein